MIAFFKAYGLTILVLAILISIVALIVKGMIKDKKSGKCHCGCDCSTCGGCCQYSNNNG